MTTPFLPRPYRSDVARAETPETDADRLIASFRVRAYAEARQRHRQAHSSEAASHWSQVSNVIARRSAKQLGQEPSTRTELDADLKSGAAALGLRPAVRFFEDDPIDELERAVGARPQRFRLQFFGVAPDLDPTLLSETEIGAHNASGAIRAAVEVDWPARATGLRILDPEGHEVFERLKADLR